MKMKRLILGACVIALMAGTAAAGGGGKIKFRAGKELDRALAEAAAFGTPVMIYFTADY